MNDAIKKHAYLIMAHGNWMILKKLIMLLDSDFNDIYLHVDAIVQLPSSIRKLFAI